MKRSLVLIFMITLLPAGVVWGVGGGSGGSSSCTEDTWTCGDWSACVAPGNQTRTCTLTFDCPNLDTPRPAGSQTCTVPTPPAAPTPAPETPSPAPTPEPAPAAAAIIPTTTETAPEVKKATPPPTPPSPTSCNVDVWTCAEWTPCDMDGNQKRTCNLTFECPRTDTEQPKLIRRCETLQCGNKENMRDRVLCRLNLSPAGIARELEIEYLPEECRTITDMSKRKTCIDTYKSYKPCWNIPVGDGRIACAKQALKLGPTLSEEIQKCKAIESGTQQTVCLKATKQRVFSLVKFRFYDLEERAEELSDDGVPKELIADFVVFIQQKKQAFNDAPSHADRLKVVAEVRVGWQKFVTAAKKYLK